jgi:cytochrome oxidase assembly protein ShyY1
VSIVGHVRRNEQGRDTAITPAGGSVMLINSDAIAAASGLTLVNGSIGVLEMTPAQQGFEPVATPPLDEGPHLSYALQWFTFALMTLIIYPLILRRRAREIEREALEAELDRADPDDVPLDGDPRIDPAPAAMPPEAGGPGTVPGGDRPA